MEITRNEIITDKHIDYEDYYRHQITAKLLPTDKITITLNDKIAYQYVAINNCNINLITQDKSDLRENTKLEELELQKDFINAEINKLQEAKI